MAQRALLFLRVMSTAALRFSGAASAVLRNRICCSLCEGFTAGVGYISVAVLS